MIEAFRARGTCTIMVRFETGAEYLKFCKYVLKSAWVPDVHPYMESMEMEYENSDDLDRIVRQIVQLQQLGFDVYSAKWKLATETPPVMKE